MKYFETKVLAGEWDEVEHYLCGFTKIEDNWYSMKILFKIRKQMYLEALDLIMQKLLRLLKYRRVFASPNKELFKEITQLLTLDNFRHGWGYRIWCCSSCGSNFKRTWLFDVVVVTCPFRFEGHKRSLQALEAIEKLQKNVDSLIVMPNYHLLDIADEQTALQDAFLLADDVLHQKVQGISDIITIPGLVNDFADVKAVMDSGCLGWVFPPARIVRRKQLNKQPGGIYLCEYSHEIVEKYLVKCYNT